SSQHDGGTAATVHLRARQPAFRTDVDRCVVAVDSKHREAVDGTRQHDRDVREAAEFRVARDEFGIEFYSSGQVDAIVAPSPAIRIADARLAKVEGVEFVSRESEGHESSTSFHAQRLSPLCCSGCGPETPERASRYASENTDQTGHGGAPTRPRRRGAPAG